MIVYFFQASLEKLPECIGIDEIEKGYPYLFIDINCIGEIVDCLFFDLSGMNEKAKQKFDKWYNSWKNKTCVLLTATLLL